MKPILRSVHSSLQRRTGFALMMLSSGLMLGASGCSDEFTLALLDAAAIGTDALAGGVLDILFDYASRAGATLITVTHDHELIPRFDRVLDFRDFLAADPVTP